MVNFISDTIALFQNSNVNLRHSSITNVTLDASGGQVIQASARIGATPPAIAHNWPVLVLLAFAVLDAQVDKADPSLQGSKFGVKEGSLPRATDIDKVRRNVYRILRIARNAVVHRPGDLTMYPTHLEVRDCGPIQLTITPLGLDLAYTYVVGAHILPSVPEAYNTALARQFYDELSGEVTCADLDRLSTDLRLNRSRRRVTNAVGTEHAAHVVLNPPLPPDLANCGYDYPVSTSNGSYLVPHEVLTSQTVDWTRLQQWKI